MRIWRRESDSRLPTGADEGNQLVDFVAAKQTEPGRPYAKRVIEYTLSRSAERVAAQDDSRASSLAGTPVMEPSLADNDFASTTPDGLIIESEYQRAKGWGSEE